MKYLNNECRGFVDAHFHPGDSGPPPIPPFCQENIEFRQNGAMLRKCEKRFLVIGNGKRVNTLPLSL